MIVASPQPVPASPVHAAANGGMFLARCAVHLSHQDRWMSVGFAVTLASAPSLQVVKERLLNKVKKEMEAMICIYPSLQVTPKPFGRSDFENLPVDVLKRDFQIQLNEVVLANFAAGTRQGIFPRVLLKSEDYKQTLNMMVLRGYTDFLECSAKVVYVDIE